MAKERGTPRYLKIAQDICGKIMNGEYPEGTLLKGRSILGAAYGVSPETVRKALNLLEKEKVVSSKRGVGVFVESVLHAQQFASRWKSETQISAKYKNLEALLNEKKALDAKINDAIDDMKDSFRYQSNEAVKLSEADVPEDSWIMVRPFSKLVSETTPPPLLLLLSVLMELPSALLDLNSFSMLETRSSSLQEMN